MVDFRMTWPQYDFLTTKAKYPAMVAGYAAGKTEAAVHRLIKLKLGNPNQSVAYYLPTYDLINTIAVPRIEEILGAMGIPSKINKQEKMIKIAGRGAIILRTMDRPERIVGYEVADSICDELDTLPKDKADDVWKKVIARNREKKENGLPNTVGVVTTPEGYKFVYDRWHKRGNENYQIIKASTYSNAHNLPEDYIDSLKEEYPAQLLQAYLYGKFVNLAFQSVYSEFDRKIHSTDADAKPNEPLHIGMDFNVSKMAAAIHVIRDGIPYAVDELTGLMDTPHMITAIKQRYDGHNITVYPDASGASRKSVGASQTDISLLRQAGFNVLVNSRNPFVRDRVLSVNAVLKKQRYFVNPDKCPSMIDGLEQQAYDKNGEPDKSTGHDHLNDGLGYFITYRWPAYTSGAGKFNLKGV